MAQVSVIVPVYRVEKYIEQCIQSILSQTVQDIEVLLINDGSPDRCGEICEAYAQRDTRIKYYRATTNQGVDSARNLGMQYATGEWLCFVDGDDYLPVDSLENLLRSSRGADVVIGDFFKDKEGQITPGTVRRGGDAKDKPQNYRLIGHALECYDCTGATDIHNAAGPWGKLYRKEFCEKNKLIFPNIKRAEDVIFNVMVYQKTDNVIFIKEKVYFYRINSASACHMYIPNHADIIKDFLILLEKTLDVDRYPCLKNMYCYARQRYLLFAIEQSVAHPDCPLNTKEKKRALEGLCGDFETKTDFLRIPKNMLPLKRRVCLWLIYKGYWGMALYFFRIKRIYAKKFGNEC